MRTILTMMCGDKSVRTEEFATLEEADLQAEATRRHSRGITQICYQVFMQPDVKITLGCWNKGPTKWFYRAAS